MTDVSIPCVMVTAHALAGWDEKARHLVVISPQNQNRSLRRKQQTHPNGGILRNTWVKTVKVTKDKARLRNCPRREEAEELGRLNTVRGAGWDPGTETGHEGSSEDV